MSLEEILLKFILSVCLGALMGLERDGNWRKGVDTKSVNKQARSAAKKFSFIKEGIPARGIGGVRTYILVSALGAISGMAHYYGMETLAIVVTLGLISFIVVSFVLNYFDKNTLGLTTEISIIINYLAGLILLASDLPAKIIVAVVVFATLIVSMKSQFHSLISKFSSKEIIDTTKFVLFTLVILPFLPNHNYSLAEIHSVGNIFKEVFDSGMIEATAIFNPFRLWLVVVFIMSINFLGYFATRVLGEGRSMSIIGLLGGLVSSTATTEAMALQSRRNEKNSAKRVLVVGAVLANMTSFIRIVFVAAVVNVSLALHLVVPMISMTAVMGGWILFSYLKHRDDKKETSNKRNYEELGLKFESPFSMKAALAFGVLFMIVMFFSSIALYLLGGSGFFVYSLIVSMTGMDAVTLTTAGWLKESLIDLKLAYVVVVSATCVNLFVKTLFVIVTGDRYFSAKVFKIFMATIILGLAVMFFQIV